MKKNYLSIIAVLGFLLAGCTESNLYTTQAQCEQTLCTKDQCYVWSVELNRCGTADALKKEEARQKRIAKRAEQKDSAKVEMPKAVRDSVAKIEKRAKAIRSEIHGLKKAADSLRVVDSLSGAKLSASAYLKNKLDVEKAALDAKYKADADSVEVLNLVNHKPITAIQWIEYNKKKKKAKLDYLEKKEPKVY